MKAYKKYFIAGINKHFPEQAGNIIAETENNFKQVSIDTGFAARSSNPIDRRLDFAAYFLALIKTLDKQQESFDNIRKVSLEIVIEYVSPKNKLQQAIKKLPAKLINTWFGSFFLKKFSAHVNKNSHPDGFIAHIITDKKETFGLGYGVDIIECGICKLFNKHNYQKYASILCEVDAVTAELAGLKLIRTSTIALGAKKCDFRWQTKN